jgi:hypothetical protein
MRRSVTLAKGRDGVILSPSLTAATRGRLSDRQNADAFGEKPKSPHIPFAWP